MYSSLRQSMAWLHTWFGLVLGYLLMVIFFFGSLSVFDREIDRWAMPETRFEPQVMPSYSEILAQAFANLTPDSDELAEARMRVEGELPEDLRVLFWGAYTTHRDPTLSIFAEYAIPNNPDDPYDHIHGYATIDPRNGKVLPEDHLKIGSRFFYPLHYSLHLSWKNLGYFIVGFAGLMMMVALVSGVVIHRNLFKELFTFRPHMRQQRRVLDLHNLTGVAALPFHFFFALTGLIVFASIYLPVSETVLAKPAFEHAVKEAEDKGLPFEASGIAATTGSVDAMMVEAKRIWAERDAAGEVGYLLVNHPGDKSSYVSVFRAGTDTVSLVGQGLHFDGHTGKLLYEDPANTVVTGLNEFLIGLHLQHFEHWLLRWLYVFGGLVGCVCIATGFLFFVGKRKRELKGSVGLRCVDAFAVTTITGMLMATVAILIANRLLPADTVNKGSWEITVFCLTWLLSMAHAFWRSAALKIQPLSPAWYEQCFVISALALIAVLLNWMTTGDHLLVTLVKPYWPVASLDMVLIAVSLLSFVVARRLYKKAGDTVVMVQSEELDEEGVSRA